MPAPMPCDQRNTPRGRGVELYALRPCGVLTCVSSPPATAERIVAAGRSSKGKLPTPSLSVFLPEKHYFGIHRAGVLPSADPLGIVDPECPLCTSEFTCGVCCRRAKMPSDECHSTSPATASTPKPTGGVSGGQRTSAKVFRTRRGERGLSVGFVGLLQGGSSLECDQTNVLLAVSENAHC